MTLMLTHLQEPLEMISPKSLLKKDDSSHQPSCLQVKFL